MHGIDRGFCYLIVLKPSADYFDIVPDMMKATRHHMEYLRFPFSAYEVEDGRNYEYKHVVRLFRQRHTDDRLMKTRYYLERAKDWLDTDGARICTTKVSDTDISPALKGNVEDFGVFDVKEWY